MSNNSDFEFFNKVPLCKNHHEELIYSPTPQCQFCLTDKISELTLIGIKLEKELAQVKHENKVYKELFKEASDYLETNDKTVICNSSLFHQKFRELGE